MPAFCVLAATLGWGLNAQQPASMIDFSAANSVTTNVGGEHPDVNIVAPVDGIAGARDVPVTGLRFTSGSPCGSELPIACCR